MFDRVVLPMADELLKPQVAARDLEGFIETKLRASALLCRSFLHFQAHPESLSSQTKALWLKIIDIMRGFFKTGRRDQLVSVHCAERELPTKPFFRLKRFLSHSRMYYSFSMQVVYSFLLHHPTLAQSSNKNYGGTPCSG
jgi:hypothetical protein